MAKPKKPWVDLDVKCPHCNAEFELKVFRTRTNEAVTAEYDYEQEVQLRLPGLPVEKKTEEGVE